MRMLTVLFVFVVALLALPTAGDDPCEPESPYLFCGHECNSGSCTKGSFTPENSWCILTFPSCDGGINHQCCQVGGGF